MVDVDLDEVKAFVTRIHQRDGGTRTRPMQSSPISDELRRELHALADDPKFRRYVEPLERYRVARRNAIIKAQADERADSQQGSAAAAESVAAAIASQHVALGQLAQPYVTLDAPFLIWEMPHPDVTFKDWHIEPHNSWFKVLIDDDSTATDDRTYTAYYLWENPSDSIALVNVTSGMSLNGTAAAWGSSGKTAGNYAALYVDISLSAIRWTGWTDPATGQDVSQTPYPTVDDRYIVEFYAYGGDWFRDSDPQSTTFNPFHWYNLSIPLMAIPGRAVTMFEVGLKVFYGFYSGGWLPWDDWDAVDNEIDDGVILDLADDEKAFMVRPGMIVLEILQ